MRGYTGLVSAMVLSIILTLAVFISSQNVFSARFSQIDDENKELSQTLAFTCAYEALSEYRADDSFAPHDKSVTLEGILPTRTCYLHSVTTTANTVNIITTAQIGLSRTTLEVKAQSNPFLITSWQEITSIPP